MSSPLHPATGDRPGDRPTVARTRHTGAEPRVLLMSSNGAGMGHLTRLLAYGLRLGEGVDRYVLSMSQAVPVVAQYGYRYEYLPSGGALGMVASTWRPLFRERLIETIGRVAPSVVVFDGTHPYAGIDAAMAAHPGVRWVWSRRGMWKPGPNDDQVVKSEWFDEVIEPGDLAAPCDRGVTSTAAAHRVGPVTLCDLAEGLPRDEARAALGLPPTGAIGLVSLGAGNINDTSGDVGAAAAGLRAAGCAVAVTQVEIAAAGASAGVLPVRAYPLARYYAAFDVVIAATGYNSFHELMRMAVPTLFVPNLATAVDDQEARARYAADQGWALTLSTLTPEAVAAAVTILLADGPAMARRAAAADPGNGAMAAATRLRELAGLS